MKLYQSLKKYGTLPVATGLMAVSSFPALASEAGATVTSTDWAPIISAMTGQISVSTVVGVIATAIGAGIGLPNCFQGDVRCDGRIKVELLAV